MRVIVSAGGTGGHIYPAISIINKIKEQEPNSEILYIGTHDRMERNIIPSLDINYVAIEIKGFKRKITKENFRNLILIKKSINRCKKIMEDFKPDVVIGVGGYVTGPVIYAAAKLKIPTFIHEQNSTPGLTNKILSRYATKIGVSFEESMQYFKSDKVLYTGNPVGEEALLKSKMKKESLGFDPNKKLVVMVMGSLGSERINNKMIEILPNLKDKDYQFLYVSNPDYYEELNKLNLPKNVRVEPVINELPRLMKDTDLLITRGGAATLTELTTLKVPSIIIPSPYVTNNHQYKNAIELTNNNQAILLEEKDMTKENFIKLIDETIFDEEKLKTIKSNLKKRKTLESSTIIYNILKSIKK